MRCALYSPRRNEIAQMGCVLYQGLGRQLVGWIWYRYQTLNYSVCTFTFNSLRSLARFVEVLKSTILVQMFWWGNAVMVKTELSQWVSATCYYNNDLSLTRVDMNSLFIVFSLTVLLEFFMVPYQFKCWTETTPVMIKSELWTSESAPHSFVVMILIQTIHGERGGGERSKKSPMAEWLDNRRLSDMQCTVTIFRSHWWPSGENRRTWTNNN